MFIVKFYFPFKREVLLKQAFAVSDVWVVKFVHDPEMKQIVFARSLVFG